MATDPKNDAATSQPTNGSNDAPVGQQQQPQAQPAKKGGFIDRLANKAINAINKAQPKLQEMADRVNYEVNDAMKKIDEETNKLVKQYEKDVERLNAKTTEIANKEVPDDMAGLLLQAADSLDTQLKVIQEQLNKLKAKNIVVQDFQKLSEAKALIFLRQFSIKIIGSAGYGRGIVLAKLKDGSWSQPCAIETVEVGAGFELGVSRTRYVIPLTNQNQIDALLSDKGKQVSLSGSMQFAFGNDGRLVKGMLSGSDKSVKKDNKVDGKVAANTTVADMQGFEIGVGAAVSVIQPLHPINEKYYYDTSKEDLQVSNILNGTINAPKILNENEESKSSDIEKIRNKLRDDAIVAHTMLVSMLSEGMQVQINGDSKYDAAVEVAKDNDDSKQTEEGNTPAVDNNATGDNTTTTAASGPSDTNAPTR